MIIDLSEVTKPIIDLLGVRGNVYLMGTYTGPRLIVKNAENIQILNQGFVSIAAPDHEEALVIQEPKNVLITGTDRGFVLRGALQVWGECNIFGVDGLVIDGAHTGIRINQQYQYQKITFRNCLIMNCKHEGIYFGYHARHTLPAKNIVIENNEVLYCDWDGIQVGNADVIVQMNRILHCGMAKSKWQDFSLCLNPGVTGLISNNHLMGKIQCVSSEGQIEFRNNTIYSPAEYAVFIKSMKGEAGGTVLFSDNSLHLNGINPFLYIQEGGPVMISMS